MQEKILPTTSVDSAESLPAIHTSQTVWIAHVFAFPVMCFSLLAVVIYNYALSGFAESDIWWHLRDARTLLENHVFLRSDTFTFTTAGTPWINFEWLSEMPYYLAFRSFGLQGLLLVYFAVLLVIFAGVYDRSCRAGADCKDAAIATLGAIALG